MEKKSYNDSSDFPTYVVTNGGYKIHYIDIDNKNKTICGFNIVNPEEAKQRARDILKRFESLPVDLKPEVCSICQSLYDFSNKMVYGELLYDDPIEISDDDVVAWESPF